MEEPNMDRRKFIKLASAVAATALVPNILTASSPEQKKDVYSQFIKTNEQFKNGKYVYNIESDGKIVGEFWPINAIDLVTKETNPELFKKSSSEILEKLGGVATAPDGMTTGSFGSYKMEGKSLSSGRECGDGHVYNYGIVLVKNGRDITFTHKQEIKDFDTFYEKQKEEENTLFFLPSLYRNGKYIDSENVVDKVLIRRDIPNSGEQIGVVIFNTMTSYNDAREILLGLNRTGKSETTHIYMLDGGPTWGEAVKEVNGKKISVGTSNKNAVTNYLVFY